jgi:hypothetical protein
MIDKMSNNYLKITVYEVTISDMVFLWFCIAEFGRVHSCFSFSFSYIIHNYMPLYIELKKNHIN